MPNYVLDWKRIETNPVASLHGYIGFHHCFTISFQTIVHPENKYRWQLKCHLPGASPKITWHPSSVRATEAVRDIFRPWLAGLMNMSPEELLLK